MSIFARIADGMVAELFTPPDGFAIPDCFTPVVAALFVAVPDGVFPRQGWTYDGVTFAAPIQPPLTAAQELAARIAQGIAITSTGTLALDGTYGSMRSRLI
jgi:hypothetical protein